MGEYARVPSKLQKEVLPKVSDRTTSAEGRGQAPSQDRVRETEIVAIPSGRATSGFALLHHRVTLPFLSLSPAVLRLPELLKHSLVFDL